MKHTEQFVWIRATQMASLPVDLTCTKTSASSLWSFLSVGNVSPTLPNTPKHSLAVKNNSWQYVIQNSAAKCFCCFREYLKILHLIRAWYYLMWVMILYCMSLRCNRSCGPTDVHWKRESRIVEQHVCCRLSDYCALEGVVCMLCSGLWRAVFCFFFFFIENSKNGLIRM